MLSKYTRYVRAQSIASPHPTPHSLADDAPLFPQLVHKYSKETASGYLSNSFWTYKKEWQAVRKIHGPEWTKELRR